MKSNRKLFHVVFLYISIILLFILLVSYAIVGNYTRLAADDYCVGGQARIWGIIDGISYRFHQGSAGGARYSYALVTLLIARFPQELFHYLPAIAIVCYLFALAYFIYQILSVKLDLRNRIVPLYVASNIIAFSFICAPDLYQILYWKVGMLTYTLPNIILFLLLSFLLQKGNLEQQNKINILVALILAYLNGAFNEALLAIQGIVLFLWAFIEWYYKKISLLFKMLIAGVFGSIISAIIIYFAPATKTRQSAFPSANQYNLFETVEKTLSYSTKIYSQTSLLRILQFQSTFY